jgi:hypothetical protein
MPFAYYTDATVVDARGAAALGVAVERLVHNRRGKRLFLSLFSCSSSYLVTGAAQECFYFILFFLFCALSVGAFQKGGQHKTKTSPFPPMRVCAGRARATVYINRHEQQQQQQLYTVSESENKK